MIVVDLTKVIAPAILAVQRATAFLAMGFRAVDLPPPTELHIDEHSMIRFFPKPLPPQLAAELVDQFRIWTIGAALRELDAGYSLYLDCVFQAATIIKERAVSQDLIRRKKTKEFVANTNVSAKLSDLNRSFGLHANAQPHTRRVSMARNVLQHGGGIVRSRECVHNGRFELTWIGYDLRMVGESTGTVEHVVSDLLREPYMAQDPDGCRMELAHVDRKKTFFEGDSIELSPHDLYEICGMYQQQAVELHNGLVKYAAAQHVAVTGEVQSNITATIEYLPNDEMKKMLAQVPTTTNDQP